MANHRLQVKLNGTVIKEYDIRGHGTKCISDGFTVGISVDEEADPVVPAEISFALVDVSSPTSQVAFSGEQHASAHLIRRF